MYDPRLPLARDLLDDLRDRFGAAVIPTVIRLDSEVKEAASFGRPVEEHAPDSMGAEDYGSLCEWVIEHAELDRPEPGTVEAVAVPVREPEPVLSPAGVPMSRAQEMAMKAATLATQRPPTQPLRRSLMPQRAVAIELMEDPETERVGKNTDASQIRHLWGCRAVSGGLLFVQPCAGVRSVSVAGSFNGWNPAAGEMTRREELGIFERRIDTPPGRYEYRLVIDGVWQCDPYNPARVTNGLGGENNLAVAT
jgi:chromosome partitioning protein